VISEISSLPYSDLEEPRSPTVLSQVLCLLLRAGFDSHLPPQAIPLVFIEIASPQRYVGVQSRWRLLFTARAQAIYLAKSRARAEATFRAFQARWRRPFASMVRRLAQDLPVVVLRLRSPPAAQVAHHQCDRALLCGSAPSHPAHGLLRKCRERGPYHPHFQRFNLEWKARTLSVFTQAACRHLCAIHLCAI